jgi:hypothetical protein
MVPYRFPIVPATRLHVVAAAPACTADAIAGHAPPQTGPAIAEPNGAAVATVSLLRAPHR